MGLPILEKVGYHPRVRNASRTALHILLSWFLVTGTPAGAEQPLSDVSIEKLAGRLLTCNQKRADADEATVELGRRGQDALPDILKLLKAPDYCSRWAAFSALRSMGPNAKSAIPEIAGYLEDPNPAIRMLTADLLGAIGADAASEVPALTKNLEDEARVAAYAAIALGEIGGDAKSAVPALIKRLKEDRAEDKSVRYAYIMALGMIGPEANEAVPFLSAELMKARQQGRSSYDVYHLRESLTQIGTPEAARSAEGFYAERFAASTQSAKSDIPLRSGWAGSNSRMNREAVFQVTSHADWVKLWQKHAGGRSDPPPVAFSKDMIVAIFLGRSSSAQSLHIMAVVNHPNETKMTVGFMHSDGLRSPGFSQYFMLLLPKSKGRLVVESAQTFAMSSDSKSHLGTMATFAPLDSRAEVESDSPGYERMMKESQERLQEQLRKQITIRWTSKIVSERIAGLAFDAKAVYVLNVSSLVAVDKDSGRDLWQLALPRQNRANGGSLGQLLVIDSGRLFGVSGYSSVFAADATSGRLLWMVECLSANEK